MLERSPEGDDHAPGRRRTSEVRELWRRGLDESEGGRETAAELKEVVAAGGEPPRRGGEVEDRPALAARPVLAVASVAVEGAIGVELEARAGVCVEGAKNLARPVGRSVCQHADVLGGGDRQQRMVELRAVRAARPWPRGPGGRRERIVG